MKLILNRTYPFYGEADGRLTLHDVHNRTFIEDCELMVDAEQGFGMPVIKYESERGPYQHGETQLLYRIDPRIVKLGMKLYGQYPDLIRARRKLVQWFNPAVYTGFDYFILEKYAGDYRQLKCRTHRGPDFSFADADVDEMRLDVELIAHWPFFIGPYQAESGSASPSGAFSFTIQCDPIGDWNAFPELISFEGSGWQNPVIENLDTGDTITFSGYTLGSETILLRLNRNDKQIVDDGGNDLMGYVTPGSDVETFNLRSTFEVPSGGNTIQFSGTCSNPVNASVSWYELYLSA